MRPFLPARDAAFLRRCLIVGTCLVPALCFYADMLPDRGGAAACARGLGWDLRSYGARFRPQFLMNGSMWRNAYIYRYSMSPADFARLKADLLADGWKFYGSGSDGVLGTIAGYYYYDVLEDDIEVAYSGRTGRQSWCLNYNHSDGCLYVEQIFGS